jgi:hypothetical protein
MLIDSDFHMSDWLTGTNVSCIITWVIGDCGELLFSEGKTSNIDL